MPQGFGSAIKSEKLVCGRVWSREQYKKGSNFKNGFLGPRVIPLGSYGHRDHHKIGFTILWATGNKWELKCSEKVVSTR